MSLQQAPMNRGQSEKLGKQSEKLGKRSEKVGKVMRIENFAYRKRGRLKGTL